VERYITDEHGRRTAVILDIEDYKSLVRAAEDIDDIHEVDEVHRQIATGEDEMLDYREARKEWQTPYIPDRDDGEG
jgi:hypothetical protein